MKNLFLSLLMLTSLNLICEKSDRSKMTEKPRKGGMHPESERARALKAGGARVNKLGGKTDVVSPERVEKHLSAGGRIAAR